MQIRAEGKTDPDKYLPLLLAKLHFLDRESIRRAGSRANEVPAMAAGTSARVETPPQGEAGTEAAGTAGGSVEAKEERGGGAEGSPSGPGPDGVATGAVDGGPPAGDKGSQPADRLQHQRVSILAALRAVVAAADDVVTKIDRVRSSVRLGVCHRVGDAVAVAVAW